MIKFINYFFQALIVYLFFLIGKLIGLNFSRKLFSLVFLKIGPFFKSKKIIFQNLENYKSNRQARPTSNNRRFNSGHQAQPRGCRKREQNPLQRSSQKQLWRESFSTADHDRGRPHFERISCQSRSWDNERDYFADRKTRHPARSSNDRSCDRGGYDRRFELARCRASGR